MYDFYICAKPLLSLQSVHLRSFQGILLCLPTSIFNLWDDNRNLAKVFLYFVFFIDLKYDDCSKLSIISLKTSKADDKSRLFVIFKN